MSTTPPRPRPQFSPSDASFTVESQHNGLLLVERLLAASSPTRAWEALAVWMLLCKALDTWNRNAVTVDDATLADLVGLKDPHSVTLAAGRLADAGALRVAPRAPHHRKTTYLLSPHLVWRGNPSARAESVAAWDRG